MEPVEVTKKPRGIERRNPPAVLDETMPSVRKRAEEKLRMYLELARNALGPLNPERRGQLEFGELQTEIKGLPDIGPDGRFLLWSQQDPNGEIHPVMWGEAKKKGEGRIDPRDANDFNLFTTLRRVNPFHSRAWMGVYRYSKDQSVNPSGKIYLRSRTVRKETFSFPVPRQLRVHGVHYRKPSLIGKGGMGGAVKYVAEDGRAVVLKVALLDPQRPDVELRAIEEVTYHAVLHPEVDKQGEPTSPLSRSIRRASGMEPDLGARRIVKYIDSVYLETETGSGDVERAVGTILEFLPGEPLNVTIEKSQAEGLRHLSEHGAEREAYHQLLEEAVQDGIDVAEALVALHGAGIEHRDLKPANLVRGEDGRLKTIDPGIARGKMIRALRTVAETTSGRMRMMGKGREPLSGDQDVHGKLTDSVQNLYMLVTTRGKGIVLSHPEYGKPAFPEERLLSFEAQREIWNWLNKWRWYQHEPMSAKERRDLLIKLVEGLQGEKGLLSKYEDHLRDQGVEQSEWRPGDLDAIKALKLDTWEVPPAETTNSGDAPKDPWKKMAAIGSLTTVGRFVGTPRYAAPEQCKEKAGVGSDVFSLGIILLERTGLGSLTESNGVEKIMKRRISFDVGLEYHDERIISKEARRLIREALKKASEVDGKKKTLTVQNKRRITADVLMKRSGRDLLAGLLRKMTLLQPSERPAAKDVLHTLNQVKTHLGKEGARWRALEQAASMEERATAKAEAV